MGIEKVIPAVLTLVMVAAATGHLPRLVREVQIAQLKLLEASQSSRWGRVLLLPEKSLRLRVYTKAETSAPGGSAR